MKTNFYVFLKYVLKNILLKSSAAESLRTAVVTSVNIVFVIKLIRELSFLLIKLKFEIFIT